MKATFIIVLINLAIICYGLNEMKVYQNKLCSDYELELEKKPVTAFSEDFCSSLSCTDDDGIVECFRCCYIHAKFDGKTYRGCYPFTYANYANASEIEPGDLEDDYSNFTDFKIHCNSKYLSMAASFIVFVFALF